MVNAHSLVTGPDPAVATDEALRWAANTADDRPGSILCLTQSRERAEELRRRWRGEHDHLRLSCTTLDDYASELFERVTGILADSTIGRPQRARLVEAAIERYGEPGDEGPLANAESPSNDLVDQIQGLFSLFEYAGYDSPEAIASALRTAGEEGDETLDPAAFYGSFRDPGDPPGESRFESQAEVLSGMYAEYERVRSELHPDWRHVVAEQYLALLDDDQLVSAVPESVDVVVLDGLTRLAPAEREAVARLSRAFPTVAVLPLTQESLDGAGIDSGVERALAVYRALGFDPEYVLPSSTNRERLSVVRSLYTHSDDPPTFDAEDVGIEFVEPATEREEVRTVARRVRALLDSGVTPADIGIVVTDRAAYRGILAEVLTSYDLPFTFVNEIGIEQTLVGSAVRSLLDLTGEESRTRALRDLATNPLVSLEAYGIDPGDLSRAAATTPDETLDALLDELDDADAHDTAGGTRDLVAAVDSSERSLAEFTVAVQDVLDELSVGDALDGYHAPDGATGSHRPAYEQSAWRTVQCVLDSFETAAHHLSDADPAQRVRRGLLAELVSGPGQQPGYVRVYPVAEAEMASFDHLFVLGLTSGYFPCEPDRMAFFEPINDADEEFGREHTGRRARYILGTLLTGSKEVTLSTPRHTVDGTEHVAAPVVSELERYVDRPDRETTPEGGDEPPLVACEDVQRSYRSWAVGEEFDSPERAVEPLASADGLTSTGRTFATSGVACSWRRSRPGLTAHDAQIRDVVTDVYPASRRKSYSPSALEDYARCPFVFLMKRVLGFEEEYGEADGISRADRGTYVHEVLASFYRRLRTDEGRPVDLETYDGATLEATLLEAALDRLDDLGDVETPFARRTVGRLLSGLGDPGENPYHGFGGDDTDGLFVRFLEAERDGQSGVATRPTYFEGAIGVDRDGVEEISPDPVTLETPDGPVKVRGIADRIDVSGEEPREFHVRDYKTGSTPGRTDVTGGTKLQLPLYGAALETALEDATGVPHEAVAASYYKLKSPDDIGSVAGLLTSQEAVDAGGSDPLAPPPTQSWRLPFETRGEFRQLIREVTPTRVGRIATAIENGAFQPTLLSASLANCEDCTFRETCDVRHHHQRDTIESLDEREHYVSERATGEELDVDTYPDGGAD